MFVGWSGGRREGGGEEGHTTEEDETSRGGVRCAGSGGKRTGARAKG